jgi:hypothetical protein
MLAEMPRRAAALVKPPLSTTLAKTRMLSKRSTGPSNLEVIQDNLCRVSYIINDCRADHLQDTED